MMRESAVIERSCAVVSHAMMAHALSHTRGSCNESLTINLQLIVTTRVGGHLKHLRRRVSSF